MYSYVSIAQLTHLMFRNGMYSYFFFLLRRRRRRRARPVGVFLCC